MPLTAAEKQKRYREKLKLNVEKYEESKKKHREHYHKVKRLVKDLTPKEKRNANIIWKLRQREYRKKKNSLQSFFTPPSTPIPMAYEHEAEDNVPFVNQLRVSDSPKTRGRKKVKKDRSKVYRENEKLKDEIANLKRKCERYRKRITRSKLKKTTNIPDDKPESSRNYNLLTNAIKERYAKIKSRKDKTLLKSVFQSPEVVTSRQKLQLLRDTLGVKRAYQNTSVKISKETTMLQKDIQEFFLRDDVSRASAGKKETITRGGEKVQKRYLLDTMRKLHKNFTDEYSDLHCSYYYFTNNRPFYVVPQSVEARETCICKMHANFMFKFNVLRKLGVLRSNEVSEIILETVCSDHSQSCMYSKCSKCKNKNIQLQEISETDVSYMQWVRKSVIAEGKNRMKSIKEAKTETATNCIHGFKQDLVKFKKHIFNIKCQFRSFRNCLNNLNSNECAIVVDFSENYACKYHEEVQEHHFGGSRNQVSLHTVMIYTYDSEKNYTSHSFCTISASVCHQPHAIWTHLKPIIEWIRDNYSIVDTVHFFSDGPSTQYRQKKNFFLFSTEIFKYGFVAGTWNFFEAGHGKGPADGIGGFLKRTADKMVTARKDISDASVFYQELKAASKIKLYQISEEEIVQKEKEIPQSIPQLVGTLQVHQISTKEPYALKYRTLSCFCDSANKGFCDCNNPKHYNCNVPQNSPRGAREPVPDLESSEDDIPLSLLKELLNTKVPSGCGIYETIYSESSDEDCQYVGKENVSPSIIRSDVINIHDPRPSTSGLSRNVLDSDDFLHVYVHGNKLKKVYSYVCKVLERDDELNELWVMFAKIYENDAKTFILDKTDIASVPYDDVIKKLPIPIEVKIGDKIVYKFECTVDVFEKSTLI